MSKTLFTDADEPAPAVPRCPTCGCDKFAPITGGSGRLRCQKCGWLIVIDNGKQRDALDWTHAGKRGSR